MAIGWICLVFFFALGIKGCSECATVRVPKMLDNSLDSHISGRMFPPHFSADDKMMQRLIGHTRKDCAAAIPFVRYPRLRNLDSRRLFLPGMIDWQSDDEIRFNFKFLITAHPRRRDYFESRKRRTSWAEVRETNDPERMVAAGYWFDGKIASCYWCEDKLADWEADPIEEHMKWAPWCPHIRAMINRPLTTIEKAFAVCHLMRTRPAIEVMKWGLDKQAVKRAMEQVIDGRHPSPTHSELMNYIYADYVSLNPPIPASRPELACKVCLSSTIEVALLPCGHLCCCIYCGTKLYYCPVCRSEIIGRRVTLLRQ